MWALLPVRFALPYKDQPIGLPIGQHISLKALKPAADGTEIFKPYTPVSDDDLLGYVDFVIKVMHNSSSSCTAIIACPNHTSTWQVQC